MPCRDYMDDNQLDPMVDFLKDRLDKLSRIACKALTHIEESGDGLEILILKDPEIQDWWTAHKEADRIAAAERARKAAEKREKQRIKQVAETARSKLTPEEIKALGLK